MQPQMMMGPNGQWMMQGPNGQWMAMQMPQMNNYQQ